MDADRTTDRTRTFIHREAMGDALDDGEFEAYEPEPEGELFEVCE